jgi:MarR family 2-MHQ and catechol resistance regulon transcriptional repressor
MARPFGVDDVRVVEALGAYVKLLRAGRAVLARVEPRLAGAGLTPTQFGVLEAILHKGPLSQRELSRKVLTSPGNMTDLIDKLEARGLVQRARQKLDRRAVQVELTPEGRKLVEPLFAAHAADIAAAMSGLNSDDLRQLSGLLRKLGLGSGLEALADLEDSAGAH